MNENKIPHIGLDIETLSLRPTATITAIAAKTFFMDGSIDESRNFTYCVDATSCAMYGLSTDQGTITWWANQPIEAKHFFLNTPAQKLSHVLTALRDYYEEVKRFYGCSRVLVWTQGSDFDIAVLRNAYRQVFQDDECSVPWPHVCVRDARTYILSGLSMLNSVGYFRNFEPGFNPERPYDIIPKLSGWVKHNADSDVLQMIHNIHVVTDYLRDAIAFQPMKARQQ